MPLKDKEKYKAYMREWYARPENRERVIEKTRARKYNEYAGVCVNCGGPTVGVNGPGTASDYCGKPRCRSAQFRARDDEFRAYRARGSVNKRYKVTLRQFIEREGGDGEGLQGA